MRTWPDVVISILPIIAVSVGYLLPSVAHRIRYGRDKDKPPW